MDSEDKELAASIEEQKAELKKLTDLSGLLQKMQQYLYNYYEPVQAPQDADFHFTTAEIHAQMIKVFPDPFTLSKDLVAAWLHNGGFTFHDFGQMKFEWLLKKV